jgi:hypothetical protein
MKRTQFIALVLAVVFGLTAIASAQESGEKITIKRDTKLGTQLLPKGEYTLRVTGADKGELVFVQGKREVLKATYTVAKLDKEAANTAVVSALASDGSYVLKRVEFKGKATALVFENAVATLIDRK